MSKRMGILLSANLEDFAIPATLLKQESDAPRDVVGSIAHYTIGTPAAADQWFSSCQPTRRTEIYSIDA